MMTLFFLLGTSQQLCLPASSTHCLLPSAPRLLCLLSGIAWSGSEFPGRGARRRNSTGGLEAWSAAHAAPTPGPTPLPGTVAALSAAKERPQEHLAERVPRASEGG